MKSTASFLLLLVAAAGLCVGNASAQKNQLDWKNFGKTSVEVAVKNAASSQVNMAKARVALVGKYTVGALYLVDANSKDDCGSAGCLVIGYLSRGGRAREVLGVYVLGRFPPPTEGKDFVRVSQSKQSDLPCLILSAGDKENPMWCFDGKQYRFNRLVREGGR